MGLEVKQPPKGLCSTPPLSEPPLKGCFFDPELNRKEFVRPPLKGRKGLCSTPPFLAKGLLFDPSPFCCICSASFFSVSGARGRFFIVFQLVRALIGRAQRIWRHRSFALHRERAAHFAEVCPLRAPPHRKMLHGMQTCCSSLGARCRFCFILAHSGNARQRAHGPLAPHFASFIERYGPHEPRALIAGLNFRMAAPAPAHAKQNRPRVPQNCGLGASETTKTQPVVVDFSWPFLAPLSMRRTRAILPKSCPEFWSSSRKECGSSSDAQTFARPGCCHIIRNFARQQGRRPSIILLEDAPPPRGNLLLHGSRPARWGVPHRNFVARATQLENSTRKSMGGHF